MMHLDPAEVSDFAESHGAYSHTQSHSENSSKQREKIGDLSSRRRAAATVLTDRGGSWD